MTLRSTEGLLPSSSSHEKYWPSVLLASANECLQESISWSRVMWVIWLMVLSCQSYWGPLRFSFVRSGLSMSKDCILMLPSSGPLPTLSTGAVFSVRDKWSRNGLFPFPPSLRQASVWLNPSKYHYEKPSIAKLHLKCTSGRHILKC